MEAIRATGAKEKDRRLFDRESGDCSELVVKQEGDESFTGLILMSIIRGKTMRRMKKGIAHRRAMPTIPRETFPVVRRVVP